MKNTGTALNAVPVGTGEFERKEPGAIPELNPEVEHKT